MQYKIRPLFEKYQNELVSFCNTSFGRDCLARFGAKQAKDPYPVVRVSPDGFTQFKGIENGRIRKRSIFHSNSLFLKVFGQALSDIDLSQEYVEKIKQNQKHLVIPHFMHETGLLYAQLPQVMSSTNTFNPDADAESTSVDGRVINDQSSSTWDNVHDAVTGSAADDTLGNGNSAVRSRSIGTRFLVYRFFALFDTSSLTDSDTIDAGTKFQMYIETVGNTDNDGTDYLNVYTTTPASNTALVVEDYDQIDTTQQATSVDFGVLSATAYNDLTLNATGRGNVSTTGITKFGLREGHDAEDDPIATDTTNEFNGQDADGSNAPILSVEHSAAVTGIASMRQLIGHGQGTR